MFALRYPLVLWFILALPGLWGWGCAYGASGTEGASFLDIPVGAKPAALGSAYSAAAEDAYATVWNPAGLGFLPMPQVAAQHLNYLETLRYEFLSVTLPVGTGGGLGAAIQYLGSGDIPGTDLNNHDLGSFSSYFAAYSLSYGHALSPSVSLGATAKAIQARIKDTSAGTFAGDTGVAVHWGEKLACALVLANVGKPLRFNDQKDALPQATRAGAAYSWNNHWRSMTEIAYHRTGLAAFRFGGEYQQRYFSLRGGYRTDSTRDLGFAAGLTAGLGLQFWNQEISYAWNAYGDLGQTHYVSLVCRWGRRSESNARYPR
jgi:hypothetical protein